MHCATGLPGPLRAGEPGEDAGSVALPWRGPVLLVPSRKAPACPWLGGLLAVALSVGGSRLRPMGAGPCLGPRCPALPLPALCARAAAALGAASLDEPPLSLLSLIGAWYNTDRAWNMLKPAWHEA